MLVASGRESLSNVAITRLILCTLVIAIVSGCAPGSTSLMDGIRSGISPVEARELLEVNGGKWHIVRDNRERVSSGQAGIHDFCVSVGDYCHLGVGGELVLQFVGERLMETHFYLHPDDADRYRRMLAKRLRIEWVPDCPQEMNVLTWDGEKGIATTTKVVNPCRWRASVGLRGRIEIRVSVNYKAGAPEVVWRDAFIFEVHSVRSMLLDRT